MESGTTRRTFLGDVGRAATASALAGALARAEGAVVADDVGIARLHLKTARLEELRRFYSDTLGFAVDDARDGTIVVRAGTTQITFEPAGTKPEPYYHFAFNIPENKLDASKQWLRPRCPILKRPDGSEEYHFVSWNAHSIYFLDPAGNILEFIARHNLKNAMDGPFSSREILYASEIALVVDDVPGAARAATAALGMEPFAAAPAEQFAAVGDDHRLLIIVKRGREWNSGHGRRAEVFAARAELHGPRRGHFKVESFPYEVLQDT